MADNSKRNIGIKQADLQGAHRRTTGRRRAQVSRKRIASACAAIAAGSALLNAVYASAATNTYTHTNTGGQLGSATFWSAGGPPTSTDIGMFNNTITTGQSESLGGNYTIGEAQIINTGGSVTIADSMANILTINGVVGTGIDMSSVSNTTNNLTINGSLALGGNQTWNVATGRSITLSGQSNLTGNSSTIANGSNNLTISGGGAVNFNYSNGAVVASGSGNYTFNGSTVTTTLLLGNQSFLGGTNALGNGAGSLTLAGATLSSNTQNSSGIESQTFSSLTLNAGFSNLTASHGSSANDVLKFTLPTRNDGGVVNLYAFSSTGTFVGIGGSSVLGYATVGSNDWAMTNGITAAVAAPTYTNNTWAAANNTTVTTSTAPGSGNTTNTLRFNAAGAFTVNLSGNNTITTGGILVGSVVGANTSTITGGNLTSGNSNADGTHDLIIINNNTTAGSNVVVNSNIVNSGGTAVGLTAAVTTATAVTGNISLGGTNTFTGAAYIDGANVILTSPGAWNGQAALNFAPAGSLSGPTGSLSLGGNSITVSGLSTTQSGMNATVQNAGGTAATLTITGGATTTFGGTIQDGTGSALALLVTGNSTQILNGVSTYTGGTIVSAGTLRVNNTSGSGTGSSGVTVANTASGNYTGGTLGGSGNISGTVTLNAGSAVRLGGIIAAGANTATTGTLTTGNETWNAGAVYNWKLAGLGSTSSRGTGNIGGNSTTWDTLKVSGLTLNSLGGSSSPAITIELSDTSTLSPTIGGNYSWTIGNSTTAVAAPAGYTIGTGAFSNLLAAGNTTAGYSGNVSFALDTSGLTLGNAATPSAGAFTLELVSNGSGDNLVLDYNAAPEPATAMLMLGGVAPMLMARRRRRRSPLGGSRVRISPSATQYFQERPPQ